MKFADWLKQKLLPRDLRDPAALDQTARDFAQRLETAAAASDPAEKLLAALETKKDLEKFWINLGKRLGDRATAIDGILVGTSAAAGLIALAAIGIAGSPVLGIFAFLGCLGLGTTNFNARFSFKRSQKYIERAFAGTADRTESLHTMASDLAEKTLEANTVAIAASPKFSHIYDNFPEIRDHFAKASSQAAARGELPAPPAPQKTGAQPPNTP